MNEHRKDELRTEAAHVILALMSSADLDVIGPKYWWDRAASAVHAAANAASSWPQFTSRAARKLQIENFTERSGERLAQARAMIGEDLATFLQLCREETPWLITEARMIRKETGR